MKPGGAPTDRDQSPSDGAGRPYVAFLASRMDPERRDLNLLRREVYNLGQELGRPVWVTECGDFGQAGRSPEDVQIGCLRYVREIPEFICILDGSYGTPWNLAQLCVLELEIFTAALADKPFHFFLLDPYEPDPRTETLINAVRLAKPDLHDTRPTSRDEILVGLRSRLARGPAGLRRGPLGGRLQRAGRAAEESPDLNVRFLDGNFTPLHEGPSGEEVIRELLSRASTETDEAARLVGTWMAIRHLCAVPYSDPKSAHFLPLWDVALGQWASAAAWYGLHGHNYLGRLAAVNTLIWIREHSGEGNRAGRSIQSSYGARASEFYSMAKTAESRALRRSLLRRAWADVNRALDAVGADASGLLAIRASVLQALGRRCAGLRDYRTVLRIRLANRESEGRIGEAQAELGMGYLRVGRIRKAGRYLAQGVANLERAGRYEFTVRGMRKLAMFYLVTLRRQRAVDTLRRARDLARTHEVKGQLQQIVPLLQTLEVLTWRGLVSRLVGRRKHP